MDEHEGDRRTIAQDGRAGPPQPGRGHPDLAFASLEGEMTTQNRHH